MRSHTTHGHDCLRPLTSDAGESLYAGNMLRALGGSSAFGFALASFYLLPKFLVDDLGASAADIGLVTAAVGNTGCKSNGIDAPAAQAFRRAWQVLPVWRIHDCPPGTLADHRTCMSAPTR